MSRQHRGISDRKNFTCFKCKTVAKGTISCLFTHFRHTHNTKTCRSAQGNINLICRQNNCVISLQNFNDFRNHLLRCTSFKNSTEQLLPESSSHSGGNILTQDAFLTARNIYEICVLKIISMLTIFSC